MKRVHAVLITLSAIATSCASLAIHPPPLPDERTAPVVQSSQGRSAADPAMAGDLTLLMAVWRDADNGGSLHLVDAGTGAELPGHEPIFLGGNYWHAISPDGRTLAVVSFPHGGTPIGGMLELIDLGTWTSHATQVPFDLWPTKMIFSPDGAQLAVGGSISNDNELVLLDVTRMAALATLSIDFDPLDFVFTPDGGSLLIYGAHYPGSPGVNPLPVAARFDARDLGIAWQIELTGVRDGQYASDGSSDDVSHDTSIWWHPAVTFAPETQRLYVVHADEDVLTTIDFANRWRRDVEIRPVAGLLETLLGLGSFPAHAKELNGASKAAVLSPDGERLFVVGQKINSSQDANGSWDIEEASLGLRSIRVPTGEVQTTIDTPATQIAWGTDSRHLLLGGWDRSGDVWTDVFNIGTQVIQAHLAKTDLLVGQPVDGASLIASANTRSGPTSQVQLIDTTSWEPLLEWTIAGYADIWYAGSLPTP